MKKTIMFLFMAILAIAVSAKAATAVVNYETIYTKWTKAVAVNAQLKVQLDDVNTKLQVKLDSRDALVRQANEYLNTKSNSEAELKVMQTKVETVKVAIDAATKEINALQASPELRKQIADQQADLRARVATAVKQEAEAAKVELVLDSTTQNGFGLPLVSVIGKPVELTEKVIQRLETSVTATPVSPSK